MNTSKRRGPFRVRSLDQRRGLSRSYELATRWSRSYEQRYARSCAPARPQRWRGRRRTVDAATALFHAQQASARRRSGAHTWTLGVTFRVATVAHRLRRHEVCRYCLDCGFARIVVVVTTEQEATNFSRFVMENAGISSAIQKQLTFVWLENILPGAGNSFNRSDIERAISRGYVVST